MTTLEKNRTARNAFFQILLLVLLSGCVNNPFRDDKTERWWCYTREDWNSYWSMYNIYGERLFDKRNLDGKTKIYLARSREGDGTKGQGTISFADTTFQATYFLLGTMRVWNYQTNGRDSYFGITITGDGVGVSRRPDGELSPDGGGLKCRSN